MWSTGEMITGTSTVSEKPVAELVRSPTFAPVAGSTMSTLADLVKKVKPARGQTPSMSLNISA
jgi:hypothetical protein